MIKLLLLFLLPLTCLAGSIPEPPVSDDFVLIRQYLKTLYDNFNNLEVVTTDPNGNRVGRYGDLVDYNNSGAHTVKICTSSPDGTAWSSLSTSSVDWADYSGTSTVVGWSSFTTKVIYTKKLGTTVFVAYDLAGTSNAAGVTFTVPYTSAAGVQFEAQNAQTIDNGATYSPAGKAVLPASSATVTVYSTNNVATGAFTASGTKQVRGQFWYEAAS